jgi:rhamnosyltransferase
MRGCRVVAPARRPQHAGRQRRSRILHNATQMLSVVIPVKDGGADLERCLKAITSQEVGEELEVVIVDSGSSDNSVEIARSYGAVVHEIPASAFTHGGSRNLGAGKTRGDILVFISQDAAPVGSDWLAQLTGGLRAEPALAGAYGRQLPHEGAVPPEAYFLDFLYGPNARRQAVSGPAELSMDTTLFSNVNSAVRKSVWEQFPFAENIVMSEDQEWSRRALLAGYTLLYEPLAVVRHSHNYSLKSAFQRFFDSGMSSERAYMTEDSGSKNVLRSRALAYALNEVVWLWRTRQIKWLPYTIVYETTKMLGLILGINHARLPESVSRRFSGIPDGWDQRSIDLTD